MLYRLTRPSLYSARRRATCAGGRPAARRY